MSINRRETEFDGFVCQLRAGDREILSNRGELMDDCAIAAYRDEIHVLIKRRVV